MAVDADRAQWEKNLNFTLKRVDSEGEHRLDFTIIVNGKRFIVTVCPTSHPKDVLAPLVAQYNRGFLEDDETTQKAQDEIENIIYDVGWRKFGQLAPGIDPEHLKTPI